MGLFVWIVVAVALAVEITLHHWWGDGLAAAAVFTLFVWVLAGIAFLKARGHVAPRADVELSADDRAALLKLAREARKREGPGKAV